MLTEKREQHATLTKSEADVLQHIRHDSQILLIVHIEYGVGEDAVAPSHQLRYIGRQLSRSLESIDEFCRRLEDVVVRHHVGSCEGDGVT